ncbi:hypothetical protein KsCSTR_32330 [Candidatus Kuenenia stuttgartiensis]|uniref:Uncharacterized protein n=1 Tax=Kuenenia stuttgartiensis TaxID=174633 RepID=Q1Q4Q1_KUEST|nr:hypothetical protein KsCSTR_32330 [Candidatus Kuenenia stuttgartiensis]CAJ74994.1 unknown protein [Candidatus Kuenenia stuttgartiensis]
MLIPYLCWFAQIYHTYIFSECPKNCLIQKVIYCILTPTLACPYGYLIYAIFLERRKLYE